MSLSLHEVEADIWTCPCCWQELVKPPERGYCPNCSFHEMIPTKGKYKEWREDEFKST